MAESSARFPAPLVSYMELIGAATASRSQTIMAAVVLVLQLAAQELVEDLRRFLEASWTDMVRFACERTDIEFYEQELAEGRMNDLLVEAVCRMKSIQLLIRRLGTPANTSRLFGVEGPLHEVVEVEGQFFTLRQPIIPWSEAVLTAVAQLEQSHYEAAEEQEAVDLPGPSHVTRRRRRGRKIIGSIKPRAPKKTSQNRHLQFEVVSSPIPSHVRPILTSTRAAARRISDLARRTLLSRVRFNPVAVVTDISPLADKVPNIVRLPEDTTRQDDGDALEAVRAEEVEETVRAALGTVRAEEVEETQQAAASEDQAAEEVVGAQEAQNAAAEEVTAAGGNEEGEQGAVGGAEQAGEEEEVAGEEEEQHHPPVPEVVEPQGPAYELDNNGFVCRLPECPAHERRFTTLKGWKIHASHTRVHQQQGFCTSCCKYVIMPPQLEEHEKKIWLDCHRREKCEGASRAVLKARRLERQRLEALWRDASHVRLPDEGEVEARRGQKRAYPTEEERRAGVCLAYIKHFKTINPARLDEVAADFQLTIT